MDSMKVYKNKVINDVLDGLNWRGRKKWDKVCVKCQLEWLLRFFDQNVAKTEWSVPLFLLIERLMAYLGFANICEAAGKFEMSHS